MTRFVAVLLFCACSAVPLVPPGQVVDKPGLVDAQVTIWRDAFGRTDASPLVYVVEGPFECTDPQNDTPGFNCPTVGCRNGCTFSPHAVSISMPAGPWSESVLAHEDTHALLIREAAAVDGLDIKTAQAFLRAADRDHKGPDWQPGGRLDKATALLVSRGQ